MTQPPSLEFPHASGRFSPAAIRIEKSPPTPLAGVVLWLLAIFVGTSVAWAIWGRLDVVAVAQGKLVPTGYLKIVQPVDAGVVKEILIREGQEVAEGDLLIRMDPALSDADWIRDRAEYHARRLTLRRIDSQLSGNGFARAVDDPADDEFKLAFARVASQHQANVHAYSNQLSQERSVLEKVRHDLAAAEEIRAKLVSVLPHYRAQEAAYEKLNRDGFAGRLLYTDKQRERLEKERDLKTQEFAIESARASIAQSEQRLTQLTADYRRLLQGERVDVMSLLQRARQDLTKSEHRRRLLELRAPQDGVVKDLATHTPGTVVAPGTILMTLVPKRDGLRAEVWLANHDVGFVRQGQSVRLKLQSFPFQKYGMVEGSVAQVSADASELPNGAGRSPNAGQLYFRALVDLTKAQLEVDQRIHPLLPGMQVSAEIHLGHRSVADYLLSPIRQAWHEAGRER